MQALLFLLLYAAGVEEPALELEPELEEDEELDDELLESGLELLELPLELLLLLSSSPSALEFVST